jgi:6,7-dimethyl-8-ribityllumazine synthase
VRDGSGEQSGGFDARGMRIAIVASRFNEAIGRRLVDGAFDCLKRHDVSDEDVSVTWVPGAYEIPLIAMRLAGSGAYDAVITLGAVIRGETAHFDLVAGHAATGIGRASMDTGVPISFGVLATENTQQAEARAGGKHGNMGFEAAMAAIEMASLLSSLPKKVD